MRRAPLRPARAWALALLLAAGCSRCGGVKSATSAEELLVQHPSGAIVTAPLAMLAQHAAALVERAAQLPGGEQLGEARRQLAGQLGFDPLTREGLLSAGLDPDRGAALALQLGGGGARGSWVISLPLSKPDLFTSTFDRLVRERGGYAVRTDEPRGDLRIALYARSAEADARGKIGAAIVRGYGLIARGEDPVGALAAAGVQTQATSLAGDPALASARKKLGGQDLLVLAPEGSELPRRFIAQTLPGNVAVGLSGSPQGIALRLDARLPFEVAAGLQKSLPGGGASLVELLPGDSVLRARIGVLPGKLLEQAEALPPLAGLVAQLRTLLHQPGLEQDLFGSLAPGLALSLSLGRNANLSEAIDYGLDWRRKSPFDTVQLVALAFVTDKPRLLKALAALPATAGAIVRTGDDFQLTDPGGKGVRFGVREIAGDGAAGKPVFYVLGGALAPEELRRTPRPVAPELAALYAEEGAALRLDLGQLSSAIRNLPDTTYGSGPQSYVARSLVAQVVEPLRPVRVTLTAQANKDAFGAGLDLEIVAP